VERLESSHGAFVLKLKGIETLAGAESVVGQDILVPEDALKRPAADDTYFDFDLIGSVVETRDGEKVGTVTDVLTAGASTLLSVERGPGRAEALVPFSRSICVDIDPVRKKVVIDPPDGLLDLNEI
jgi:16S rRNA processing protein RimM